MRIEYLEGIGPARLQKTIFESTYYSKTINRHPSDSNVSYSSTMWGCFRLEQMLASRRKSKQDHLAEQPWKGKASSTVSSESWCWSELFHIDNLHGILFATCFVRTTTNDTEWTPTSSEKERKKHHNPMSEREKSSRRCFVLSDDFINVVQIGETSRDLFIVLGDIAGRV